MTSGSWDTVVYLVKYIQTVLLIFRRKHELVSKLDTWPMTSVSWCVACCLFLACTWRTVSPEYIFMCTDGQTVGRSLKVPWQENVMFML